jgi:hypothetical protein
MKRGRKPKPELRPALAAIHRLTADGASSNAAIRSPEGADERAMAQASSSMPVRGEA